jgi:hypothetical protein
MRERWHLENPNADGRRILRWVFKKWDVAQNRERWRASV